MINERDVIRMKVAYPSVSSALAYSAHMYICNGAADAQRSFVKCQTLKPYMINNPTFRHFVDEQPNINRNPFVRPTRIDCDKQFTSRQVVYDDKMKTPSRPDVCPALFADVVQELAQDGHEIIAMNETTLLSLNPLITQVGR